MKRNSDFFCEEMKAELEEGDGRILMGDNTNSRCPRVGVLISSGLPFINTQYTGADKSLARSTSQCILFDGENISFDASLVIYINRTNIIRIMIINRIYENQNFLSL